MINLYLGIIKLQKLAPAKYTFTSALALLGHMTHNIVKIIHELQNTKLFCCIVIVTVRCLVVHAASTYYGRQLYKL